jgi:hypothetical protein
MTYYSVKGYYGGLNTPALIFVCAIPGGSAYCIEGSRNINLTTQQPLTDGVWVEELRDFDYFQSSNPIWEVHDLLEELEKVGL